MVTIQPPAEGLTAAETRRWSQSGYSWSQRPVWGSNAEELPTQNLHRLCAQRALQEESPVPLRRWMKRYFQMALSSMKPRRLGAARHAAGPGAGEEGGGALVPVVGSPRGGVQ